MAREHIADGDLTFLEMLPDLVGGIIERAAPAADPDALARRQQQALEALYPDPNIRKLVPPHDREAINLQVADQWRAEVESGPLYELGEHVHRPDYPEVLTRVEAAARRTPSQRGAWLHAMGLRSTSSTDALLIEVVDLQRTARVEAMLKSAPPSRVLAAYLDGDGDTTASARRWIEQQHGAGWTGPQTDDVGELEAVQELRRAIEAERAARVPAAVQTAREALAKAADTLRRIELTAGLRPRRPKAQELA